MMKTAAFEKYEFKPFCGSSHSWALSVLKRFPKLGSVLDVGPGSGAIGRHLRAEGVSRLLAVETDEPTREKLATVYDRIEQDIAVFAGERVDAILLLDVLEHMPEPEAFLSACIRLLNPDGIVLVSTPNIAHWTTRLALLFGFFEYTHRGILDRTHLHFFTRGSLLRMLKRCRAIQIEEVSQSIVPLELLLPGWAGRSYLFSLFARLRLACALVLPRLFAYQILVLLRAAKR